MIALIIAAAAWLWSKLKGGSMEQPQITAAPQAGQSAAPGPDGWVHPTGGLGKLTSPFGPRTNPVTKQPQVHNGQDLAVPVGTPVLAAKDGSVTVVKHDDPIAGRYIIVDHGGGMLTEYLHLSAAKAAKGDKVKAGQVIGLSGGAKGADGAGRSTGPHLHFIVKRGGVAVDPATVIASLRRA